MKLYLLAGLAVATSGACGTSVKLDPVPIEDKTGVPVAVSPVTNSQPQGSEVSTGQVSTVNIGGSLSDAEIQSLVRLVYFDYDSFAIRPSSRPLLNPMHAYSKRNAPARSSLVVIPTSVAGASTTSHWDKSVRRLCAKPCPCKGCWMRSWRR